MKKLLLVLLTLASVFVLGACSYAPAHYVTQEEYNELEEELDATQEQLEAIQSYLDRMVGQFYILPEDNGSEDGLSNDIYLSRLGFEMMVAKEADYMDKTKFPNYIWDLDDNYISVNDLGNLLSQKYLGVSSEAIPGLQYKIQLSKPSEMSDDEYMARVCMMIIELSLYDFYTIDSPELYIELASGGSQHIKVRMSLLVTDKYNLHPAIFWNKMLDVRTIGIEYDVLMVEEYYDTFILDGTFEGYVLDIN